MKLFGRFIFAVKYNIYPEFIVIPYGDKLGFCRFVTYEDASYYADECFRKQPMFGKPEIVVIVSPRKLRINHD